MVRRTGVMLSKVKYLLQVLDYSLRLEWQLCCAA